MRDILICNAKVYDGSGSEGQVQDVLIRDGIIAGMGHYSVTSGTEVIDGKDQVLCPGFIDSHAHSDLLYPECRNAESKVMQGVTTDISGLCGMSRYPCSKEYHGDLKRYIGDFIPPNLICDLPIGDFSTMARQMSQAQNATNIGCFVGHGTLRIYVMGMNSEPVSSSGLAKMKGKLRQAMEQGALGMSSGLAYAPGYFASVDELAELCKELVPFNGIYDTHIRDEGPLAWRALEEAHEIACRSKCRLHISHHKVIGAKNRGFAERSLALFEKWRKEGIDVSFDVYPYCYGSTSLGALLPKWIYDAPKDEMTKRRDDILKWLNGEENLGSFCGWDNVWVDGKSIAMLAEERNILSAQVIVDLFFEMDGALCLYRCVDRDDLDLLVEDNYCSIGSDGYPRHYNGATAFGHPHPRSYGTFPKFLREYSLERKQLPLSSAIAKVTSFPAKYFGIKDRGLIRIGNFADLVLFNPRKLHEISNYNTPNVPPCGISYVMVNGQFAVRKGSYTGICSGRFLRRN